jgi:DNA excision repair protein ERCC-2
LQIQTEEKRLVLSVGELVVSDAGTSDSPAPIHFSLRGRLGAQAHRAYQNAQKTSAAFRREVYLDVPVFENSRELDGWKIRICGRLDGLIEELDRWVVEEIKSVALPPARFAVLTPDWFPRHRRQLEIYLYLIAVSRPEKAVAGRLTYLNLPDNRKRAFEIEWDRAEIEALILDLVRFLIEREVRRQEERRIKRKIARMIRFPFPQMRPGQGEIADALGQALASASSLLIEAPTGAGKTAAALYGVLPYALQHDKRIFFLTSKTTQQDLVFQTARKFLSGSCFPRVLLMRARQKICPADSGICSPDECRFKRDFSERFRQGRILDLFLKEGCIHPNFVRQIGDAYELCPYELQLELTEEADLIIGDYNYIFDPVVRLNRLFKENDPEKLILIVDEAHNLPDRARSYYSPVLSWDTISTAMKALDKMGDKTFQPSLQALQEQFEYYLSRLPRYDGETSRIVPDPFPVELSLPIWRKILENFQSAVVPYWYRLMEREVQDGDDPVLNLQRELESFLQILEIQGENFAHLVRKSPQISLEILCLDPAPQLQQTFSSVYSAVCMSATLQPLEAYQRLLGLDPDTAVISLPSPFPPEHCRVIVDSSVTTLYREREANVAAIVSKIERFYTEVHKNILLFFPSYEFMRRILSRLQIKNLFVQEEGLSDAERSELLTAFRKKRHAALCSVMGGVFAEGIDLPGRTAEAAVIVGVPLPQVTTENELIRAYFDRAYEEGFRFAYLYPGMRRVVQAVGRIIRRETDRGIILLLDRRYTQKEYQNLLPKHWHHKSPVELASRSWEENVGDLPF